MIVATNASTETSIKYKIGNRKKFDISISAKYAILPYTTPYIGVSLTKRTNSIDSCTKRPDVNPATKTMWPEKGWTPLTSSWRRRSPLAFPLRSLMTSFNMAARGFEIQARKAFVAFLWRYPRALSLRRAAADLDASTKGRKSCVMTIRTPVTRLKMTLKEVDAKLKRMTSWRREMATPTKKVTMELECSSARFLQVAYRSCFSRSIRGTLDVGIVRLAGGMVHQITVFCQ